VQLYSKAEVKGQNILTEAVEGSYQSEFPIF